MALEKCKECNTLMSDKAGACLNCGYPISGTNRSLTAGAHVLTGSQYQIGAHARWRDLALLGTFTSVWVLIAVTIAQI